MGIDMRRLQENSADNSEDLENSAGGDSAGSAENEQLDFIMKSGSVISKKDGETIHCLTIIGQVEGHFILGEGQ